MRIIYISGRYRARTIFGKLWNIWKARRAAQKLWKEGWIVICPHLNTFLFDESLPYIEGDCEIIRRCCDAIYMLKDWMRSEGAIQEWGCAIRHKREIYYEEE